MILEEIKAVEAASLSVKVMVAVSPDFKVVLLELMVIVGAVVSTVMEIVLEAVLLLPAASVKVPEATLKVAVVVLFAVRRDRFHHLHSQRSSFQLCNWRCNCNWWRTF